MSGRRIELLIVWAVLLGACGCAHRNQVQDEEFAVEETVVHVTNRNWSDMNIYVTRGGVRHRLGTVTSQTKRSFTMPRHMVVGAGNVHLLADPIGSSRTYQSPALVFGTGQVVEWRLENNLNLSSAFIR